jgi:hypothetical protein
LELISVSNLNEFIIMKKIVSIIILTIVFMTGCKKDFLEYYPTNRLEDTKAFSTPENAMAVLYGIYDLITNETLYGSFLSVTNDLRGNDVFLAEELNWSWWVQTYNFQWTASNTDYRGPRSYWQYLYATIENCNTAINATLPWDEAGNKAYVAEVKAIRAWSYYALVTLYCQPYLKDAGESPGVPVYTVSDPEVSNPRGKVKDVYTLMQADLTTAIADLPLLENAYGSTRISKCFANGLAARVALAKGDYTAALTYVNAALADAPPLNTNTADYVKGFSHANEESILIDPFNSDDYPIYWALSSYYDHPEGYGNTFVNSDFVSKFAADDIRRKWFITPLFYNLNDAATNVYLKDYISEVYHFEGYLQESISEVLGYTAAGGPIDPATMFDPNLTYEWYRPGIISIYGKFPRIDAVPGSNSGSVGLAQPTLMRTSELILIKAECEARKASPNYAGAQDALFLIQQRASASAVKSVSTGATLISEIMMERRKELVGEGFAAIDLLRTGSPLNRPNVEGPNWSPFLTLPAYDWRMIFPIPEAEMDANKTLTPADQNQGY